MNGQMIRLADAKMIFDNENEQRALVTHPLNGGPIYSRVRPTIGDRIYASEQVQRKSDYWYKGLGHYPTTSCLKSSVYLINTIRLLE
jgi:hypothetical protein